MCALGSHLTYFVGSVAVEQQSVAELGCLSITVDNYRLLREPAGRLSVIVLGVFSSRLPTATVSYYSITHTIIPRLA